MESGASLEHKNAQGNESSVQPNYSVLLNLLDNAQLSENLLVVLPRKLRFTFPSHP